MIGKFAMEVAEARIDQERDAAVARARAGLRSTGATDCVTCGTVIPEARRKALPSARQCIDCADAGGRR